MHRDLITLLIQALLFSGLNIGFRLYLKQPLISACSAFWFGWIFLVSAGLVAVSEDWRSIGTLSTPYIRMLFWGALAGFFLATFSDFIRKPSSEYRQLVKISGNVFNKYGKIVLGSLLLVGTIFFIQRLETVGFSANYLSDVRDVYNHRSRSMLLQIGSHLSVLMTMLIILRGIYDSYHGVNLRMLILTILCGAPIGLANGGRMFLLSYTLAYLASLFLCRSHFFRKPFILTKREILAVGFVIVGAFIIFAVMGFLRGGYGDKFNIFYTVIIWPVSTLCAMDSWVMAAILSEKTYGLNTFGWIFDFFSRSGLIDSSSLDEIMEKTIYHFQSTNNSAVFIPRSILPDLIFDFGQSGVFLGMMVVAFFLEVCTNRYTCRSIFLHVLAVQCLLASLATIQNSVVTPGFAVTIFYAGVFSIVARHYGWSK